MKLVNKRCVSPALGLFFYFVGMLLFPIRVLNYDSVMFFKGVLLGTCHHDVS